MSTSNSHGPSATVRILIAVLAILILSAALFLVSRSASAIAGSWFWFTVVFIFIMLWSLLAGPKTRDREPPVGPHMLAAEEQPQVVRDVMDVRLAEEERGIKIFRGPLRESADAAFAHLKAALVDDTVPLVQPDERCGAVIMLMRQPVGPAGAQP